MSEQTAATPENEQSDKVLEQIPLEQRESHLISLRRLKAGQPQPSPAAPVAGLALSGGGIRSATFNLGVLRALARTGLLWKFDYLSTVSGGGYIGSFFGAWVNRAGKTGAGIKTVDEGLKGFDGLDEKSLPIRYLRENGRYLTPNGSTDAWLSFWVQLRSQLTVLWLLLLPVAGTFLLLEALKAILGVVHVPMTPDSPVASFLWPVVGAVALLTLLPFGSGYWFVGAGHSKEGRPWATWLVSAFCLGVAVFCTWRWAQLFAISPSWLPGEGTPDGLRTWAAALRGWHCWPQVGWWMTLTLTALAMTGAILFAAYRSENLSGWRRSYTSRLAWWASWVGLLLLFAALDTFGQWLAREVQSVALATAGPVTLAAVIACGQRLGAWLAGLGEGDRLKLPVKALSWVVALVVATIILGGISASVHVAGQKLLAMRTNTPAFIAAEKPAESEACCCCAGGTHSGTQADASVKQSAPELCVVPDTGSIWPDWKWISYVGSWFDGKTSFVTIVLGALGATAWFLAWLFGRGFSFVNNSSLHRMYSSRLTRAYVGASNEERTGQGIGRGNFDATEVQPKDDIELKNYKPHAYGGPLHLINVTVNETVSGQSNVDKEDRHGLGMSIGPVKTCVGSRAVIATPDAVKSMMLGDWIGISGAAFTTGMGANTSLPLSFLLALFNVRLGFWWDSKGAFPSVPVYQGKVKRKKALPDASRKAFPAQSALFGEMTAQFHGTAYRHWYLSDGGHFENTACYELIRRRVPLIVCCDCGADDTYTFEDLAGLVRKARIDFGAEITFLDPKEDLFSNWLGALGDVTFTDPEEKECVAQRFSAKHGAVATVRYSDGAHSILVLLKPTLTKDLPVDIIQYDSKECAFPQESTLDQFFDEAQWESYHKLGLRIGEKVFGEQVAMTKAAATQDTGAEKAGTESVAPWSLLLKKLQALNPGGLKSGQLDLNGPAGN